MDKETDTKQVLCSLCYSRLSVPEMCCSCPFFTILCIYYSTVCYFVDLRMQLKPQLESDKSIFTL